MTLDQEFKKTVHEAVLLDTLTSKEESRGAQELLQEVVFPHQDQKKKQTLKEEQEKGNALPLVWIVCCSFLFGGIAGYFLGSLWHDRETLEKILLPETAKEEIIEIIVPPTRAKRLT